MLKSAIRVGLIWVGATAAFAAGRELPDPFVPYPVSSSARASLPAARSLHGVRPVLPRHGRYRSYGLLFGACLCLVMLEWKVLRRAGSKQRRLAGALAGALHSGVLEFSSGGRPKTARFIFEEPEEETGEEPQEMPSRYALLAYHKEPPAVAEPLLAVTRQYGIDQDLLDLKTVDTNLLLGVPLALLPAGAPHEVPAPEGNPLPSARWLAWPSDTKPEPRRLLTAASQ